MSTEHLALEGGQPVRTRPLPSGKKVGKEELKEIVDVIDSGNLFRWGGTKVKQFEEEFARILGRQYAVASTSGTAAIHVAMGMLNPSPGDEIITSPITDIGSVIPILYQTAIPIFAEVHPETLTLDPESIEKNITPKTKAIMPVHLFGSPSDMDAINDIAKQHGLMVIEDCSQSHFSTYKGKFVGTLGDIGTFSLQHSKHMTAGDGGITVTDNEEFGIRGKLFADKGWQREDYGPRRYVVFGPNYRMNELTGAVAIAQLRRGQDIVAARRRNGDLLTQLIEDVEPIRPQKLLDGCQHGYWLYGLIVRKKSPFTADEFSKAMRAEGIPASPHYIGKPIFLCHEAVRTQTLFGDSHFPFDHPNARQGIVYDETTCPVTQDVLDRLITLPMSEFYSEEDVRDMAAAVRKVARLLRA
jgi:dTDP-4-amino-4,6-dideoxygalactose transaminase